MKSTPNLLPNYRAHSILMHVLWFIGKKWPSSGGLNKYFKRFFKIPNLSLRGTKITNTALGTPGHSHSLCIKWIGSTSTYIGVDVLVSVDILSFHVPSSSIWKFFFRFEQRNFYVWLMKFPLNCICMRYI